VVDLFITLLLLREHSKPLLVLPLMSLLLQVVVVQAVVHLMLVVALVDF
jgi:hypothetical protein